MDESVVKQKNKRKNFVNVFIKHFKTKKSKKMNTTKQRMAEESKIHIRSIACSDIKEQEI